jgi:hypothetical protein
VLDTLAEIQERHRAVKDLEQSLLELHQIFLDMAVLVEAQVSVHCMIMGPLDLAGCCCLPDWGKQPLPWAVRCCDSCHAGTHPQASRDQASSQ